MHPFRAQNLNHIRTIFQEKTGAALPARRAARRPMRMALAAAAAVCMLALCAFAPNLFSGLAGDELSLLAVYEGNGLVTIQIENRSGKDLRFQPKVKLMRWVTSEELPASGDVAFEGGQIAPHSSGVLTVDLSGAYDLALLETPLEGSDWYYLVLTNNNFAFGQDWMCSVDFALEEDPAEAAPPPESPAPAERAEVLAAPEEAVSSVSPVLPGNRISSENRLTLLDPEDGVIFDPSVPSEEQLQLTGLNWHAVDAFRQPLAGEGEYALVVSAGIPHGTYPDATRPLPLFYLFTYEKEAAQAEGACAFLCGELVLFSELEQYQVFEDEQRICCEVSALVYGDLDAYIQRFMAENTDLRYDEGVRDRIGRIYAYYQDNWENLLCFADPS